MQQPRREDSVLRFLGIEDSRHFRGYLPGELPLIAAAYDIEVKGQLRSFLLQVGRSDGGLWGPGLLTLYGVHRGLRSHILFQGGVSDRLKGVEEYQELYPHNGKPFVIGIEYETQYYVLLTENENADEVYRFDENTDRFYTTGQTLFEWLRSYLPERRCPAGSSDAVGDLLSFFPPGDQ